MCGILYHQKVVAVGNVHYPVHIAGHACIVHGYNYAGTRCYESLYPVGVYVGIILAAVAEYDFGTLTHKCQHG